MQILLLICFSLLLCLFYGICAGVQTVARGVGRIRSHVNLVNAPAAAQPEIEACAQAAKIHASHQYCMDELRSLFALYHCKGLDHPVRHKIRTEESVPVLLEFKAWLDKILPTVVPKSGLGKAIGYALDQWSAVTRFVEDGRLAIDNNIAERESKAVVIGRKNWLFADSMDGMRANATMYSLVQTAKANGINSFDYLRYVFETIPLLKKSSQIECLLPWNMPR